MPDLHTVRNIKDLVSKIDSLQKKTFGAVNPHRSVLLFAICKLIERTPNRPNKFFFDQELEGAFKQAWMELVSNQPPGLLEYPFYHMISSGIWHHRIKSDKDQLYAQYRRFTASRINETIDYAFLDPSVFELFGNSTSRGVIEAAIISRMSEDTKIVNQPLRSDSVTRSTQVGFFPHEQDAMDDIASRLKDDVKLIRNHELYDPSTQQYLECDLIALDSYGAAIIELKHWRGEIEINPVKWVIDGSNYRDDPHKTNQYKCKVLSAFIHKGTSKNHFFSLWIP